MSMFWFQIESCKEYQQSFKEAKNANKSSVLQCSEDYVKEKKLCNVIVSINIITLTITIFHICKNKALKKKNFTAILLYTRQKYNNVSADYLKAKLIKIKMYDEIH